MTTPPAKGANLDLADPLASFRDRFVVSDPDLIYLDGNSLGRLPRTSVERARELVEAQWGERLIRGWNDGWLQLQERIGAKIARLIGAAPDEVIVADSTSVNLYKLVTAALRARPERRSIVSDDLNFPSDLYVLRSAAWERGRSARIELRLVPSSDGISVPPEAFETAINDQTALVALSHTAFKSAFVHDLAAITRLAHERGAWMLWDLSHSAGVMPVDLGAAGADLAVGCSYKYLHGGPGAPAFLYVRRDLQDRLANPIAGWFGRADPFGFDLHYEPESGIRHFLTGSPPILSLALIEPGVDLVLEAGIDAIRDKSVRQTEYLVAQWQDQLAPLGYRLGSPRDPVRRGSHVSLAHNEGYRITGALIDHFGVIPDFRHPDNIRLGVSPLCTTYTELDRAAEALRAAVEERVYLEYPEKRSGAT